MRITQHINRLHCVFFFTSLLSDGQQLLFASPKNSAFNSPNNSFLYRIVHN
ncbi:hypothetical protein JCM10512_3388 [Bacteroides reticulotermitis JCM 10512]|uniref:Uncharacterized protein n=1 Tax=Bacteroides reticulotermitis JCM 10512 TaxID=1445607 RepID=W4UWN1_9BACE|nr:hypothetical protein JCM10512_3388 [Bacteroides reticulotermitis JCM 10512]